MENPRTLTINLEFADNGAILEYPGIPLKQVIEGSDDKTFAAIGRDIQDEISQMETSGRYQITIKIQSL